MEIEGLQQRHEHLLGGVLMLREARANLIGAIDRTTDDTQTRVKAALQLVNHALAEMEEAVEKVAADISVLEDPAKIHEAEIGHRALADRFQDEARSRTPDKEKSDGG